MCVSVGQGALVAPNLPDRREVEARMRELIAGAGLPPPDAVEHDPGEVVFFWHEQKLVVSIDLADEYG